MDSPFDTEDADYVVLINADGQHSLWPETHLVPAGWEVVFGSATRPACLKYVRENWTDLRPRMLAARLGDELA